MDAYFSIADHCRTGVAERINVVRSNKSADLQTFFDSVASHVSCGD
jgi:hypothetical protein